MFQQNFFREAYFRGSATVNRGRHEWKFGFESANTFLNENFRYHNTPELARAQRQRKKAEAPFAELKNQIGLPRLRLQRLKFVRERFFLAASAQNIKRLVRFLSQPTRPALEVTA